MVIVPGALCGASKTLEIFLMIDVSLLFTGHLDHSRLYAHGVNGHGFRVGETGLQQEQLCDLKGGMLSQPDILEREGRRAGD